MSDTPTNQEKNAGYRVLARKYRPRDFSDLIGQEAMIRTLTNAFKANRIAQAWMLTGVRGVGKTTTARILARALNYQSDEIDHPSIDLSVLGNHCQAIMDGRHVDVVEMDAASHTGIDDIREIIEQVRYVPSIARYKVYIIDEVHMLSKQAFNGLLKTLEEPPAHAKFIFATTEIRKVPITVLSRCQRFDLRRVEAHELTAHLEKIVKLEEVEAQGDALAMIARAGEGSVRDSLSILDQAIAHGAGSVTCDAVRDMLGLANHSRIIDLFESLMKGDMASALGQLRDQYNSGADPVIILNELAQFNHLVTRMRFVPEASEDASLTLEERTRGAEFSNKLSVQILSRCWQMLLKGISEVTIANSPIAAAEMVLIRIAHAADLPTLDQAIKQVENYRNEDAGSPNQGPSGGGAGARAQASAGGGIAHAVSSNPSQNQPQNNPQGQTMRLVQNTAAPEQAPSVQPNVQNDAPAIPLNSLEDIVALAEQKRDLPFKVKIKRMVRLVSIEPGRMEISLTEDAPATLVTEIVQRLIDWTGTRWIVSLSRETGEKTISECETEARENLIEDARLDPVVAAVLETFKGSRITDVRVQSSDDDFAEGLEDPDQDYDLDDDDFI